MSVYHSDTISAQSRRRKNTPHVTTSTALFEADCTREFDCEVVSRISRVSS